MNHRPEANIYLMDDLYASAIPDLVKINTQALSEATRMDEIRHPNAPEYLDLELVPDFMKDPLYSLRDIDEQKQIATETLSRLHKAWRGSEVLEKPVNENLTNKFWDFVDGMTLWTVVESHRTPPSARLGSTSAYLSRDTRPVEYTNLLIERARKIEELHQEPRWREDVHAETEVQTTQPQPKRHQRVAKAVGKWLNEQASQPPRPGRL